MVSMVLVLGRRGLERERFFDFYCASLKNYLRSDSKVLELESTALEFPLRFLGGYFSAYVSTNISLESLSSLEGTANSDTVQSDCGILPFREEAFDLIHITYPATRPFIYRGRNVEPTFYHTRIRGSVGEVDRVLKVGGIAVLSTVFLDVTATWRGRVVEEFEGLGYRFEERQIGGGHKIMLFGKGAS